MGTNCPIFRSLVSWALRSKARLLDTASPNCVPSTIVLHMRNGELNEADRCKSARRIWPATGIGERQPGLQSSVGVILRSALRATLLNRCFLYKEDGCDKTLQCRDTMCLTKWFRGDWNSARAKEAGECVIRSLRFLVLFKHAPDRPRIFEAFV
jgi:hypothetical protein